MTLSKPPPEDVPPAPPASWFLLRVWLLLSLQSFGGGSTTLVLIRRALVDDHRWVTEDEFVRDWALCQACPGINLLCFTILAGRRIAGWRGIFLCLFGLLFPSATVTILITAFYSRIRDLELVQAALRAIIPATVGLGLLAAFDIARPSLRESKADGMPWLLLAALLLGGSGVIFAVFHPSPVLLLAGAGTVSGLLHFGREARKKGEQTLP